MASADAAVSALISRFEALSPHARVVSAPDTQAQLESLDLSERIISQLWREVFVPLVAKAKAEVAEQREAVRENAGAVVLKGVVGAVGRHPRKLDRDACAALLVGSGTAGQDDPAYGVAAGIPETTVLRVLDQLVAKGLLEERGGRLERRAVPQKA